MNTPCAESRRQDADERRDAEVSVDLAYERRLRQGGDLLLREASAFFAGRGTLHQALRRLAERLAAENIAYALLGGLALAEHGYPRLTQDLDLLLSPAGLARFRERLVGRGYRPALRQPFDTPAATQDKAQDSVSRAPATASACC